MGYQRRDEWETSSEVYTSAQVEAILEYCGIDVDSENFNGFLAYCPFHPNTDSPAFGINIESGRWSCFNPSCDQNGDLMDLLRRQKGLNPFEATRIINKYKHEVTQSVSDRLAKVMEQAPEFVEFPSEPVARMQEDFWNDHGWTARGYMNHRGFEEETLKYFGIGYSIKKDMVIVPMHDPKGMLLGFVGRSIEDKAFKNTPNLPKSRTAWNYHRAKSHGESVIVVESSFDAMRVHQAGYPNVIALLGGHISTYHAEQIAKSFSKVIIMTDFDKHIYRPNCRKCTTFKECQGHRPGRELGHMIVDRVPGKRFFWAAYDDTCVYPHGAKDAGDMTDDEIRTCLRNAVSNFEYSRWGIESKELLAS